MLKKISSILEKNQIFDFGVVAFDDISSILNCKAKVKIPATCASIIVCTFPYYWGESEQQNLCKYACLPDYHNVLSPILKKVCDTLSLEYPGEEFQYFIDSSPFPEVELGVKAGLGVRGKNNLLLTPKHGSFVFIAEIATTLNLTAFKYKPSTCCSCNKCKDACPNNAITDNGIEYSRCLSNITQKKGELTKQEQEAIKKSGVAWGCDVCQNVCPANSLLSKTHISEFLSDIITTINEENIDELLCSRSFAYKGKKVIKRNMDIIKND
ncbi:MAG: DUF1730 domain-containing protein [Oscillospiraceae bacterium]